MKEKELIDLVSRKFKPIALYLCPQGLTCHLRSPDIHILAIVESNAVADFHYLPEVAKTQIRIEVSAVGRETIAHEIINGPSTWVGFLTIAKLRAAKPLVEDESWSGMRQLAVQRTKMRPSLIASMIKVIRDITEGMNRRCTLSTFLASNSLLLHTVSAIMAIKLGKTFIKTSDVLIDVPNTCASSLEGFQNKQETKESALEKLLSARVLLNTLFDSIGIDHSKLIGEEWQQEK